MKYKLIKYISIVVTSVVLFSNPLSAKTVEEKGSKVDSEKIKLINIAGQQRMLSQRIAKDYLYVGKNIALTKTKQQLKVSLEKFFKSHKILVKSISDPEIRNLLEFVELSSNEFKETSTKPFNLDNAQLILDLSESMLEGSQYVVDSLNASLKFDSSKTIERAAIQRMFSQRIAKYYIAYQSGIKDQNTISSMKKTVKSFQENLNFLLKNKINTPVITKKLNEINKLWKIVHKFYNNIEKGGLPLIVFDTTDKITQKMDEVTTLYISIYK
ncbi:type IV pili methyl-accepting chemotaxis transducer N-terminal domain-containing protein [bacterium]|nr:type IV pili methyl-accepting chemotaxis transducer N-terminal domain-containing protein [bacterium]MBU1958545.1 type IV pili methyl-accepting chemotaxis transducer N-terminal domain-containing protein [bacterium]